MTLPPPLAPPQLDDPEKRERAAIVWFTLLVGMATVVGQAIGYLLSPSLLHSAWFVPVEGAAFLAGLVALRRGNVAIPSVLVPVFFAGLITVYVFKGGGLDYGFPALFGTMAAMGALMSGPRLGVALTAYGVVCTFLVFAVGADTELLIGGQDPTEIKLSVQLIGTVLTGSLVTYAVFRLSEALRNERDAAITLARTAEQVENARRYTADIVRSMAEGVFVVDAAGKVLEVNDAAVKLLGAGVPEQLLGEPLATIIDQEQLDLLDEASTPGTTAIGRAELRRVDGRLTPVRVARSPVTGEDGQLRSVYVIADISVLVEAQRRSDEAARQAEAANRAKSRFLANMSHELRTPLNAVIGYADMLIDDHQGDDATVSDLQRIRGAGTHLLSLINDVLDMSKIEAGRMEVVLEQVDIDDVVYDVRAAVLPSATQAGIDVVIAPFVLPPLRTDERKLRQILLNLVSNGVKFTESGEVRIAASVTDDHLVIEVSDTGIGIEPDVLARLFQPFVQGDGSTSRRFGGTGLGLALSRRFAEMLGGTLAATSHPGRGSTFTLTLPTEINPLSTPAPQVDPGSSPLVLVVDDDAPTLDLLGRILKRQGLRVALASNATDALEIAREHRPAVITLDVMMPDMDGWSLLRRLRSDPMLRDVPVVMVSMVDHNKASALSLGASDYLVKPVEPDALMGTLGRYLTRGSGSVLVVEDEPDIRELMRRLLVGEGWQVHATASSEEALVHLQTARPDLILLDLMLPGMDGFAFVEQVRATDRLRDLPIVVLTAMDLTGEQLAELAEQTSRVVHKSGPGLQRVLEEIRRYTRR